MKLIHYLALICLIILTIWIDLPENWNIPLQLGNRKTVLRINPLRIDTKLFGVALHKEFKTHLGLDLKGGSHFVFEADVSGLKKQDLRDALDSVKNIIEQRVNFFGVSEPSIQLVESAKSHRINVDMPGVSNPSEAVTLIGQTAQLTFREELINLDPKFASFAAGFKLFDQNTKLTGKDVKKATVEFDSTTGKPQVVLRFSDVGGRVFADLTRRNIGKQLGIFLDGNVISAPVVQQEILGGTAVISGNFTVDQSKQLAIAINSGALPVPIKLVEQRTIGPTLGAIEVRKSLYAGMIGLSCVMLFMMLYYGRLGIIACVGLVIYGLLSLALFRVIPVVLTLSGIAGFILSIGMAVDSNILISERIKEEKRKGRDHDAAVRMGFGRAIDAIKDANVATLLVGFILFNPLNWTFLPQFGLVRGFALTLMIGVGMSLFTGVFITKRLIQLFYKQ